MSLKIYTILGQEIRTLMDGERPAGYHRIIWSGRDDARMQVESGVYFVRMQVSNSETGLAFVQTRKLIFMK